MTAPDRTCDECGQRVPYGAECPECLEEAGQLIHDRCCQQLMELPYDYGRTIPTDDE